jgi:flavin reductase (DIM6/NTAB) family NADH-FMN oxidoreductase RutF
LSAPDTEQLRHALARYATGVAIVTTTDASGNPVGMTVNSFASVSLTPPLVLWSVGEHAPEFGVFRVATNTAIHVLGESQVALSNRFADPAADKFAGIDWSTGQSGAPILADCNVCLQCVALQSIVAGDHQILVSRVASVDVRDDEPPLVFFESGYRQIGAALDSGWG